MNNSSESIYHFTDDLEVIKSILKDQSFIGSYCKEDLRYKEEEISLYVPMISFCDIPIKTYSNLGAIYGKYGIGISKSCAIRHKLTPVLYIDKNSALLDNLIKSIRSAEVTTSFAQKFLEMFTGDIKMEGPAKQLAQTLNTSVEYNIYSLFHTKHYADTLVRKGVTYENYKFYDEREWRYVPDFYCEFVSLA